MEFSKEDYEEILTIFNQEGEEIVNRLNNNLLILEKDPENKDVVLELFRDAHSLKGAARMIGFNDIQNMAHKIEDILGVAKERKLNFSSGILDVIYKAIDFINICIEKSIEAKKEVKLNEYGIHVKALEKIIKNSEMQKNDTSESTLNTKTEENSIVETVEIPEYIKTLNSNVEDINAELTEILYLLKKLQKEPIINTMSILKDKFKIFSEFFTNIKEFHDINTNVQDVIIKLDFVIENSGILKEEEIVELNQKFAIIINSIVKIFNKFKMKTIDYQDIANQKLQQEQKNTKIEQIVDIDNKKNLEIANSSSTLIENLQILDVNPDVLDLLFIDIKKLINLCDVPEIVDIYEKIADIFTILQKNNIRPAKEILTVLRQSVQTVEKISLNKKLLETEDINLLLQRLSITQQMLELANAAPSSNDNFHVSQSSVKNNLQKFKQTQENLNFFDANAIKTLRVDTKKLDKLVNQIGEVIISKIKTKKHILELDNINSKIEELYDFSIKSYNYLKYYDKKLSQHNDESDINSFINFNKQMLTSLMDYQTKLYKQIQEMVNLHKNMQEDDAKFDFVVGKLEEMVKDIRLLPLATVFHMIPRMVRDIAKEKGKEIDLDISGSETNADKKIIDEIKTPLIHIIRNAVDHGIETVEDRIALNKSPVGKIFLTAAHRDNKIIISVEDDGRGVNLEKIKQKALDKSLLTQEEINSMNDEQIMNLIFWPGFSTEDVITDISGRGIGLDVVRTKISQLNGKVNIKSIINEGACVTIELPVTMATIKAFVIRAASQLFAIPLIVIKSVLKITNQEIYTKDGKLNILYDKKSIPIFNLAHVLGFNSLINDENPAIKTVVVLDVANTTLGFLVDELIGDQEILNKELAPPLFKLKNISGITTLAGGEICLIINVSELVKNVFNYDSKTSVSEYLKKTNQITKIKTQDTILVVDDSLTTRTMLKNIISSAGYIVEVAPDAIQALELTSHKQYDLIITDVEMPYKTGIEFAEKLRQDAIYTNVPIIAISSLSSEDVIKKALNAGIDTYITKKDFEQKYLLTTIANLLKEH